MKRFTCFVFYCAVGAMLLSPSLYAQKFSPHANAPDGNSRYQSFAPDGVEFRVAEKTWDVDMRGNHRALVTVPDGNFEAVIVNLPWRRPDLRIDTKKIIVTDAENNEIKDVTVTLLTPEKGQLIFRPEAGKSEYYVYYMPFKFRDGYGDARYGEPWNDYLPPVYEADKQWADAAIKSKASLPVAEVQYIESRTRFNFWSPMGLIATAEETESVKNATKTDMVVFPEDRAFPIQLKKQLPSKWNKAPVKEFTGSAQRNEYYVWQLGVWAAGKALKNVKVSFSDFWNGDKGIPASEITCFNQEGTNWDGKHIEFTVNVPESEVQALWCGVQIPRDAKPGCYHGKATVTADGTKQQTVGISIIVNPSVLADKGDSEEWRHGRLRWLNSTIALDDEPVAPFGEMTLEGNTVGATGKSVRLGKNGMITSVSTNGKEIFEQPQQFIVSTSKGDVIFSADNLKIRKEAAGLVTWNASSVQNGIRFDLSANMEFDGHLHYEILVSAEKDIEVKDVRLVSVYSPYASEYYMGCGVSGGYRPEKFVWDWTGPNDSYWTGGALAGMHTEFRGGTYHGPLINDYKPAPTPVWSNDGKGRVSVKGAKGEAATVTASTGKRVLSSTPVNYEFNLLITPVKKLDPAKHFSEKYYHGEPADYDKASEDGCNVSNIHHAGNLNPYINYPFLIRQPLITHIRHQHDNGRKVKLYYTIRELTTHCEEVYAFHSLNHEIFAAGVGYGLPWECEHLIDDYKPAWYTSMEGMENFEPDAALVLTGNSRFINYWLEGLRWMEENYDIDGIYMDDVSFDRTTVKRIRKILDRYHDGALIDLHSNTGYSKGPANQYTDFFPYVNRLWFGESFQYDSMTPDEWFVTFSGIPFGEMSEMLQDGGNRFLGMVYGTTARHAWTSSGDVKSPVPVWKFWDSFGITEARMVGYWDPACAVTTDDPEVKATTYVKNDKVLVSVGNFSSKEKKIHLKIDWKALGMDASLATIEAPAIDNFQEQTSFSDGELIPVRAKEGWLIVISPLPSWSEEFDGETLDASIWSKIPRGASPWCFHMSDYDELYQMGDGKIALRAIVNPGVPDDTASLLTGGIWTKGKKNFGYGRLEICAKLDGMGGGWPAIWMMPAKDDSDPDDPFWKEFEGPKNYGEIDICERLNFDPFAYQTIHTSFNLLPSNEGDPYQEKGSTCPIKPDDYNIFTVEHYRDSIKLYINGVNSLTYRKMEVAPDGTPIPVKAQWTFDREFYLFIDMQMGHTWPGPAVLEDLPAAMTVDWVRFYPFPEE